MGEILFFVVFGLVVLLLVQTARFSYHLGYHRAKEALRK